MTKLNIAYLHSHDTGRYLQPYGHAIPAPCFTALAREGVLFRQAFCAAPTCSPSRAALLSGMWPHVAGMIGLAHRGFRLTNPARLLPHVLREAGYHTVLAGLQHVAPHAERDGLGYAKLNAGGTPEVEFAEHFLRHEAAGRQPFFLDVGFFETHRRGPGFAGPPPGEPPTDPRYVLPPAPLPDTPACRQDFADFIGAARTLDAKVGRVLQALSRSGLADSTLVLATTDHGIAFPGMKCNLTDHGLGVLLILRGPAGEPALRGGSVCDALVSQIDLFPTLCELARIAPPPWLQGRSLLPVLHGQAAQAREELFAEVTYHAAYEPMRAVRTRRHKLIRRYDNRTAPVLPNCDDSPSKNAWLEGGWRERVPEAEQLHDLLLDPQERRNRADDPAYAEVLADLRERLDRWMRETGDPLLRGPVPCPPGAAVNDPDGLSPTEEVLRAWSPRAGNAP